MAEEIRVVMFGKTGVGKSCLGNNILGENIFVAEGGAKSVTENSTRGERMVDKYCKLVLVDTPGLFDTSTNDNLKTAKILASTVKDTKPGPHVFIFVLSIGRFTAEERVTVEFLKDFFGRNVTDYLIIVFTGKDAIDFDEMNFETYIKDADKDLKSIVSQCQGKMAINNRGSPEEITESVHILLKMIKRVYLKNEKRHYTDEVLTEAQTIYEEKLRKQNEETRRREQELKDEIKKLGEKKDFIINENEKLQEDISKVKEQNQIDLRKQAEEACRRERKLEDETKTLREEKDLIIKQNKEYQDKQKLENEKLQEDISKVKEQNQKQEEEARMRERELEEANKRKQEIELQINELERDRDGRTCALQ